MTVPDGLDGEVTEVTEVTAPWGSALYTGWVRHRRRLPRPREFRYRLAVPLLDLDEVPDLVEAGVLGTHPWSPLRFRDADYGDPSTSGSGRALPDRVRDLVAAREGFRPEGPVSMLAHVRTWGWCFNPLTVHWCHHADGSVAAAVLEVTNTPWRERVSYTFDLRSEPPPWCRLERKRLHVSPYLPMDLVHRVRLTAPGRRIHVGIDDLDATESGAADRADPVFDADMVLERQPLTTGSARRMLVSYPLMTLRVSAAIHTQALRLWLRRTPVHRHRPPVADPPASDAEAAASSRPGCSEQGS